MSRITLVDLGADHDGEYDTSTTATFDHSTHLSGPPRVRESFDEQGRLVIDVTMGPAPNRALLAIAEVALERVHSVLRRKRSAQARSAMAASALADKKKTDDDAIIAAIARYRKRRPTASDHEIANQVSRKLGHDPARGRSGYSVTSIKRRLQKNHGPNP